MLKINLEALRGKVAERSLEKVASETRLKEDTICRILDGRKFCYPTARKIYLAYGAEILANGETLAFETIPQAPRYEVNRRGDVRNKKTGKIRKWVKRKRGANMVLFNGGKRVAVTRGGLLWQLFGIIKNKNTQKAVRLIHNPRSILFDSHGQAARFLQTRVGLTRSGIMNYFWRRSTNIYGWDVEYPEL